MDNDADKILVAGLIPDENSVDLVMAVDNQHNNNEDGVVDGDRMNKQPQNTPTQKSR